MASNNTATQAVEGKKKRKAQGPRTRPILNILLTINEDGEPEIVNASYNAQETLTSYVSATQAGRKVKMATWQAPATEKKADAPAA